MNIDQEKLSLKCIKCYVCENYFNIKFDALGAKYDCCGHLDIMETNRFNSIEVMHSCGEVVDEFIRNTNPWCHNCGLVSCKELT